MDVFNIHDQLIGDYSTYIRSFINIADERIGEHVVKELEDGALWPDPLLQLNPNFEPGASIDDLVTGGQLHPLCREIFRIDKAADKPIGKPLHLHKHQTEAVEAAASGDNYVLTTGTGSGKSLAYIIPIVDYVLKHGSGKGVRAVVVYPMNALANSQLLELEKFLGFGFPPGNPPVTFRRYTGQESDEDKQEIITNPPDILLTNYVMLELVMTRPHEKKLIHSAKGLQFLVLDELHTYRGRQGADVAMLVRRVRDYCESPNMQIVGTSATLAEGGPFAAQQEKIAEVATKLFGAPVKPERIIGETLERATKERLLNDPEFVSELVNRLLHPEHAQPKNYAELANDPLSVWLETTFGLAREPESGRYRRATPISINGDDGAAAQLSELTEVSIKKCINSIQNGLLAAYDQGMSNPETGFPLFAFRLHQFISRGDTVYASLEDPTERYITLKGQQFVPGDRGRISLPLVFCRECGQEYYSVTEIIDRDTGQGTFIPRELRDQTGKADEERGFLYRNPDNPWPEDEQILEVIPEDWLETSTKGLIVKRNQRKKLPRTVPVNTLGKEDEDGLAYHFVVTPFPFCLNCGVAYGGRERSDFAKLASLSSEGRSTATTVLSLSAYRALDRDETLARKAKKLLSFTDNRQDASLQAGHFNDFVEIGLLRSAVYRAVSDAGGRGLEHDVLPQRVFEALDLPPGLYAIAPEVKFKQWQDTERALREVLAYRMYQDLKRGWRVTSPNLEQCGLLRIEYDSLDELCWAEEEWRDFHPALSTASPSERGIVAKALLDLLRRELAIKVDYLDANYQERIQQRSSQRLVEPWSIDEDEVMTHASVAFPRSRMKGEYAGNTFVSPRSGFGIYLRRQGTFPNHAEKQRLGDSQVIIQQLFEALSVAGLVEVVHEAKDQHDLPGYQLPADAMIWYAGDATKPFHDPVRMPRQSKIGGRINPFFTRLYQDVAIQLKGVYAREHTAQVPMDERLKREALFRTAELPVLYCSPTMELGVDISLLNVVNMRNVPPTPANYAQRSGRAGRSGQPAMVFTYCTTGSPHDQYHFKRPGRMVSGAVAPPRLDIANEDLILSHVHAVWLAETGQSLGTSLKDILNLGGDPASLELLQSVKDSIISKSAKKHAAVRLFRIFQSIESELEQASWYDDEWLQKALQRVGERFEEACGRWRNLYWAAQQQQATQHAVVRDASRSAVDKNLAARLRAEAEAQLRLLTDNSNVIYSDFYSYRYFASEGFLPGYNFPRLPLSAYIPARKKRKNVNEYLNRPRFLAISEFGPRAIIYHEGSRYIINRVILPVGEDVALTTSAKLCPACGYLHHIRDESDGPDLCERCGVALDHPLRSLFRMQNVATRRRDRINSDEEERLRMGYELITGVRFNQDNSRRAYRTAEVYDAEGEVLYRLTYGDAATIWRINLGWKRRKEKELYGFVLDTERGYWGKNESEIERDPDDPSSPSQERVIPFVEDRRNCLLIEPAERLSIAELASLQPAIKGAIQALYQLEDRELAAEPMPSDEDRRLILLYESAEGGAGILRQLMDDTSAIAQVAEKALELCHFDLEGNNLGRAPGAKEDCEAACYDCLMSYYNQRDHGLLDRHAIRRLLLYLSDTAVKPSPGSLTHQEHMQRLKALCDSDLERDWLEFLEERNLALPDEAQKFISQCRTRVDFWYGNNKQTAIFIDGPMHDLSDVSARDREIDDCLGLFNMGLEVIRFHYLADWEAICAEHPGVFGDLGNSTHLVQP